MPHKLNRLFKQNQWMDEIFILIYLFINKNLKKKKIIKNTLKYFPK